MLAVEVGMAFVVPVVAGLQHHVNGEAQRIEQFHERLEEALAGDGRHQHGHVVVVCSSR